VLKREFDREIARHVDSLVSGNPTDFAEYQYIRGQIDGIQFAINALNRISERIDKEGGD